MLENKARPVGAGRQRLKNLPSSAPGAVGTGGGSLGGARERTDKADSRETTESSYSKDLKELPSKRPRRASLHNPRLSLKLVDLKTHSIQLTIMMDYVKATAKEYVP